MAWPQSKYKFPLSPSPLSTSIVLAAVLVSPYPGFMVFCLCEFYPWLFYVVLWLHFLSITADLSRTYQVLCDFLCFAVVVVLLI